MKNFKLIFLLSIVLVVIGIMPSQVFGKETLNITIEPHTYSTSPMGGYRLPVEGYRYNVGGTYIEGEVNDSSVTFIPPIADISLKYDEVIFDFSGDFGNTEAVFRFRVIPNGEYYIGKYMIENDRVNKKLILKKIGMTLDSTEYAVSPYYENDSSYFQAGAIYFDDASDMGYTAPFYKVEAEEKLHSAGWVHKFFLGNSHLTGISTVASTIATHPECYVFCSSKGKEEKDIYHFSEAQVDNNVKIKLTNGDYEVDGEQSAGGFNPANGGSMQDIVYTLSGLNSEIMDQQQGTGLEAILAKIGISVGDLLLSAFRACVRSSKH